MSVISAYSLEGPPPFVPAAGMLALYLPRTAVHTVPVTVLAYNTDYQVDRKRKKDQQKCATHARTTASPVFPERKPHFA